MRNLPGLEEPLDMIKSIIISSIKHTYHTLHHDHGVFHKITITIAPAHLQSDFQLSTNFAMVCASVLKQQPQDIATTTLKQIEDNVCFEHVECSPNGFVNMRMSNAFWHEVLAKVLNMGEDYGLADRGKQELINVEYVSANPTGPLHIGHARSVVYGDIVSNLLQKNGFRVVREYYINDHGSQIKTLLQTAYFRYKQALNNNFDDDVPLGCYPGEYMITIGHKLVDTYGDSLLSMTIEATLEHIRTLVLQKMMQIIKDDLQKMDVKHDVFVSETNIVNGPDIEQVWQLLLSNDMIYEGILEQPKGKEIVDYQAKPQSLFRSTTHGDDVDRPLKKADGGFTYFMTDIAYHYNKYKRGFHNMIIVLGADHKGYAKRISAAVDAISAGKAKINVIFCELVNFMQNGKNVKMSKRAGNFLTVSDLLQEIDPNIVRFIMLTRKNDTVLNFDLHKVKDQSSDNPIFYVQYAHSRCHSILRKASEVFGSAVHLSALLKTNDIASDVECLQDKHHLDIIIKLASYPSMMKTAVENYEPHLLIFYIIELSTMLHSLWNAGQRDPALRFIIADNITVTKAHLLLVIAVKNVIAATLDILGVKALETM